MKFIITFHRRTVYGYKTQAGQYTVDSKSLSTPICFDNFIDFKQQFVLKNKVFIFISVIYFHFIIKPTIF